MCDKLEAMCHCWFSDSNMMAWPRCHLLEHPCQQHPHSNNQLCSYLFPSIDMPPPQLIWKVAILLLWSVYHIELAYKLKPVGSSIAHHMRYALYFSSFSISLLIPYRRFCLLSSPLLNQCWWHCRLLYPPLDGTDQPHPSLFHFSNILISLSFTSVCSLSVILWQSTSPLHPIPIQNYQHVFSFFLGFHN